MTSEQRRIFLLCRRMLQDADEADSTTQDVFLKAYRALAKRAETDDLDNPGKWLTRIAVNTCLDKLRSKSWKLWHRRPPPQDEELILQMAPGTDPDANVYCLPSRSSRDWTGPSQTLRPPASRLHAAAL